MKRLLNFFGSKWRLAESYGPPCKPKVCEPFAGGAAYSLYWECKDVTLVEKDPCIYDIWRYLTTECTEEVVMSMNPDAWHRDHFEGFGYPKQLIDLACLWFSRGSHAPRNQLSPANRFDREFGGGVFWGMTTMTAICDALPLIRNWKVIHGDYSLVGGDSDTLYFVDPPYFSQGGARYRFNNKKLDYAKLADWCRQQKHIIVTEGGDADWLPFEVHQYCKAQEVNRELYAELIWQQGTDTTSHLFQED